MLKRRTLYLILPPLRWSGILALGFCFSSAALLAQGDRIHGPIDNARRVLLRGHLHPNARPEFDQGRLDPSTVLQSLALVLKPSAAQQTDLEQFLASQQDRNSPDYHRWLTPEQFAGRFGATPDDVNSITAWLQQRGFQVTGTARARNLISFSGTVAAVETAFGLEMHRYQVNGEMHFANATEPSLPVALEAVVRSVRGLHDFRMQPHLHALSSAAGADSAQPAFTAGFGAYNVAPDDFATIYDLKPLYNAGIDGTGQTIAIAGQTQIRLSDIDLFRSRFNLPAADPQIVLVPNTVDPGIASVDDLAESDLDLEWSGAVARNASIIFVYSLDVMDAVHYAIDQNLAPVLSVSYGSCETETLASDALAFQSWARQANAQGITWMAASGDSGGADCIFGSSTTDGGPSVDVPASIPEVTGLGGTEFNEGSGTFWATANNASGGSALSYIPEVVWNDSTPRNPAASGGGASVMFLQPSWQNGPGVPNDNARNVPDVSLAASADHDGYFVYTRGRQQIFGGTSVAAPSFAGIVTLLNQYLVSSGAQSSAGLGNINPALYALAQNTTDVFHDIVQGNNVVTVTCSFRARNCTSGAFGFAATPGYDQATGLGSVDAQHFVLEWNNPGGAATSTPSVTVLSSADPIQSSDSVSLTAIVTSANGTTPSGSVTFFAGMTPLGSVALLAAGPSATATLTVSGAQLALGDNTITAQYSGDSSFNPASASVTVTVSSSASALPSLRRSQVF